MNVREVWRVVIVMGVVVVARSAGQDVECCSQVTGSCRSFCEKMSLVGMAANANIRNKTVTKLHSFCSSQLTTFWECLNGTLDEMSRGSSWSGRTCCFLGGSSSCRRTCAISSARGDLEGRCRLSDELELFACVDRQAQGDICCAQATSDVCRAACGDVFRSPRTPTREQRTRVSSTCQDNAKVMHCVRNYTKVTPAIHSHKQMSRGSSWSGRTCCFLGGSSSCRRTCAISSARGDLEGRCRLSDELELFACVDRQAQGDICCAQATSDVCRAACGDVFRSPRTPTREQRTRVSSTCQDNAKVMHCVRNYTKVTPATNSHKHLHCCDKSGNSQCREACKKVLKSKTTHQEIADNLQEECGPPSFQDTFWQCFLTTTDSISPSVEVSRIDRLGMDSAKLHCCHRAISSQCKKLCARTFTNDWTRLFDDFDNKCLSHLAEEDLRNCIDEVEEPCELGCDGLSYCTNFNNRPTELFRSCNTQADEAARYDVAYWQQEGHLTLPGLQLPLRNISRCSPNTWKTIACALQIKPCTPHSHATQICRDACEEILNECMDWSRAPNDYTASSLCAKLSPENPDTPCVSLQHFMKPSDTPYTIPKEQISSPCKGEPCGANQICSINRNCVYGSNCRPYICTPGCKMGEVSQYLVPDGAHVRIPLATGQNGCLKICKCGNGSIEECQPLPCFLLDPCWLGKNKIEHGVSFSMDCNMCSCFAGEIICSKKQCDATGLSVDDSGYTTLPCNCPLQYSPICGRNGVNYPNLCLARCAMLPDADIEYGSCEDPCESNPCPIGQQCVPDPKVCLSLLHNPCKQYQCINSTVNCSKLPLEPVCDTDNIEHQNSCYLLRAFKRFAYRGPCLQTCNTTSAICGANGKTYTSECAALADLVSVDYHGPCSTIGVISDFKSEQCGSTVQCPALPTEECVGFTPPGACCPVCGGVVRLLYSRKQIDRALYALHGQSLSSLTLRAILKALERQIQIAQCSLTGYLSIELDVIVVVRSNVPQPSGLQLEACVKEAEKLASLVTRQSPRMASELSLSALTTATVVHTTQEFNGSTLNVSNVFLVMFVAILLLLRIER